MQEAGVGVGESVGGDATLPELREAMSISFASSRANSASALLEVWSRERSGIDRLRGKQRGEKRSGCFWLVSPVFFQRSPLSSGGAAAGRHLEGRFLPPSLS